MSESDITIDEVRRIAHLARLSLGDEEAAALTEQLAQIVGYVDRLAEVELDTAARADDESPSALRDDVPVEGLARERVLDDAPSAHGGHFIVPKVVD